MTKGWKSSNSTNGIRQTTLQDGDILYFNLQTRFLIHSMLIHNINIFSTQSKEEKLAERNLLLFLWFLWTIHFNVVIDNICILAADLELDLIRIIKCILGLYFHMITIFECMIIKRAFVVNANSWTNIIDIWIQLVGSFLSLRGKYLNTCIWYIATIQPY